jgi:DNA-binding response OmpR family regulator
MNRSILVADADEECRGAVAVLLRLSGFLVSEAKNGEEAVRIARERHPDLILLEPNLPIFSGRQVAALLNIDSKTADIPLILLAGHDGEEVRSREGGSFSAWVPKPFTIRELMNAVGRAIEGLIATH